MNKKRFISWLLSASMLMPLGMFNTALAADHQEGAHDFGDPFAPYVDTKLVLKSQIKEPETILHTSKKVLGSDAVTADIIESSAQFYTRDNGNTLSTGFACRYGSQNAPPPSRVMVSRKPKNRLIRPLLRV